MPRKKIRAKKKVKKKKFMQKEGPILGFHMTAMLVSPNNEMAAMLVSRSNPPGIESYYYANVFFCFRWETWLLITWVKPKNCDFYLIII